MVEQSDAAFAGIDDRVRRIVFDKLRDIHSTDKVEHLIAVESGSRAWGFPSPDSDFDVRFIYLRPPDWYLSLKQQRDVIDRPIVDDFDVSGWDIRKTLGLLLKHNAVVSEWLNSPIRYLKDHHSIGELKCLVDDFFDPHGYAAHYASLANNNVKRWDANANTIPAKRYFYALRPALAVRAIRLNPEQRPPMTLQELIQAGELPHEITAEIIDLVEMKRMQREAAPAHRSEAIERLVLSEIAQASEVKPRRKDKDFRAALDAFFINLVLRE